MERFTVSNLSVVSKMISDDGIFPTAAASVALRGVRNECKEKFAEVHFLAGDKVRFIRWNNRIMKVPKKCLRSLDELVKWIHERIEKA